MYYPSLINCFIFFLFGKCLFFYSLAKLKFSTISCVSALLEFLQCFSCRFKLFQIYLFLANRVYFFSLKLIYLLISGVYVYCFYKTYCFVASNIRRVLIKIVSN